MLSDGCLPWFNLSELVSGYDDRPGNCLGELLAMTSIFRFPNTAFACGGACARLLAV